MRIALGLEYDGTPFTGWQSQPSGLGVQDMIETALEAVAGSALRAVAAGRTDTGVHATSQVVHFDVDVHRPLTAWVRGVNAHLPAAIAVLWAHPVEASFHARFSATARHYTYVLINRPVRTALLAGRAGWYHRPLDADLMRSAALALLGRHDFSAFRAAECQARTPVKTLSRVCIDRTGDLVRFDFSADAFLHHMIRNMIGALVHVGAGKAPVEWLGELLRSADRARAPATFEPDGLYFTGVDYPPLFGLPSTRADIAFPWMDAS